MTNAWSNTGLHSSPSETACRMAEVRRGVEYFLTSKLCETACRMAEESVRW